jgi:hypothetical protein
MTTIVPAFATDLGVGPRDAIRQTKVRSALGDERGDTLRLDALNPRSPLESIRSGRT